jgi:hypothetical protein
LVPRVLSGLAAFLIGVIRALRFGERWRYNRAWRQKNRNLLLKFDSAAGLPEADAANERQRVADNLSKYLDSDTGVPLGSGVEDIGK